MSALAAGFTGCGSSRPFEPTATGGAVRPADTSSGVLTPAAATVRYYSATISPGSAAAGSSGSYTMTLTNCNGAGGNCGSFATNNHQQIGSATVAVPALFNISGSVSVTPPAGKTWNATLGSGTITLEAATGTSKLEIGESLSLTFSATAPCANGAYEWTTRAYADTPLALTTPYTLAGTQPSVGVTGTCAAGCTLSQGYWKNHPANWPASSLTLGANSYTASQLLTILGQAVQGNGLVSLAHQLIAAKLNVANGTNASAVASTITASDVLIGGLSVPPIGAGWIAPNLTGPYTTVLDNYNSGLIGPGHCPE